jgi:hypothetical protein
LKPSYDCRVNLWAGKHASRRNEGKGGSDESDLFGCSQSLGRPLGLYVWSTVIHLGGLMSVFSVKLRKDVKERMDRYKGRVN